MSPSGCSQELREQGLPHARTCAVCKLGPCQRSGPAALSASVTTTQQKALALRALAGDFGFSLHLRATGTWYVCLLSCEVAEEANWEMLASPTQLAATPEAAIEAAWQDYAVKPYRVVVNALRQNRRELRWNGFMWEEMPLRSGMAVSA